MMPQDVDGLFQMDSDAEVHRYLGNQPLKEKTQAENVIQFVRQQYLDNGIGRWAMVDKETGYFVGWTGLKLVKETVNGMTNFYDLGYRLLPKYWGHGLATESAMASLTYGFDVLGLEVIYAAAHVDNIGSNSVLRKVGMQVLNSFDYDGELHYWYELDAKVWEMLKTSGNA